MYKAQIFLNALIVFILCGILLAAFGVQFLEKEHPCPLCLLQRLGMIGAATACLLNLRYGIKMSHYGLCLLSCLVGGFVALRQISLHVCPAFPKFGLPVLGLSLYTWSFFIFVSIVLSVALLLFLYDKNQPEEELKMDNFSKAAFGLIFFITLANAVATFFDCGFGPCVE